MARKTKNCVQLFCGDQEKNDIRGYISVILNSLLVKEQMYYCVLLGKAWHKKLRFPLFMARMELKRNCTVRNISSSDNVSPINLLPDEMLLKIFSYLPVDELCFSIPIVCNRWNYLSTATVLWKSKWLICGNHMPYITIENILSNAPLLQVIELQWRADVNLILNILVNYCKNVMQVNLVCCGNLKSCTISNLFSNYPLLEHLSLEKCWMVEHTCYDMIYKFVNLKSLNVSHSKHFPGKTLRDIVDFCPHLVHLNIDYVRGIVDNDLCYLIDKRRDTLLSLVVFGESLTDVSFSCLDKCYKLKKLHISRCNLMTKLGLKSISKLTQLTSLKLRFGNKLRTEVLLDFLHSKAVNNLKYLCLSRSENFTDAAAAAVADNCKQLRQLDVMYCQNLTEFGRQILLSRCLHLQKLNFSEDISPVGDNLNP